MWCWRRLLRDPWTARRSSQSILKEISPEYSLEGLMLKLNLQYFGHWWEELTHLKRPWCWGRLGAGGEGDNRGRDGWMASLTQWTSSTRWWRTGRPGMLHGLAKSWRWPSNWTTTSVSASMNQTLGDSMGCTVLFNTAQKLEYELWNKCFNGNL